jgi:hypothetical protein
MHGLERLRRRGAVRWPGEDDLRQILERVADHPVKREHQLLPWNVVGIRVRRDQRTAA